MARDDKLVERLGRFPAEAEFADVRKLMESAGWRLAAIKGSHARFTKPDERSIPIPFIVAR
jgi:predicted RNA binding protein YcfA (HicA-like mRNA interferase family)